MLPRFMLGAAALGFACAASALTLISPAFNNGAIIPNEFTYSQGTQCTGQNQSPPLTIGDIPSGVKSFALLMTDTTVGFRHWKVWNIPAHVTSFPTNYTKVTIPAGQSNNDFGSAGYGGPCPPDATRHNYSFTLFALNTTFTSEPSDAQLSAATIQSATLNGTRAHGDHAPLVPSSAPLAPVTGWYWNPNESGRGYYIEKQNQKVFFATFIYDQTGSATWYVSICNENSGSTTQWACNGSMDSYKDGQTLTGTYKSPLFGSTFSSLQLLFTTPTTATLNWTGGSIPIQRFDIVSQGGTSAALRSDTGWWWAPSESGRGWSFEIQGDTAFMAGYMYRDNGTPVWYVATGKLDADGVTWRGTLTEYMNGQAFGSPYRSPQLFNGNVSDFTWTILDKNNVQLKIGTRPPLSLIRFTF